MDDKPMTWEFLRSVYDRMNERDLHEAVITEARASRGALAPVITELNVPDAPRTTTLCGIPFVEDPSMPDDRIEFRDRHGNVLQVVKVRGDPGPSAP